MIRKIIHYGLILITLSSCTSNPVHLSYIRKITLASEDTAFITSFPKVFTINDRDFVSYINYIHRSIDFVEIPSLSKTSIYLPKNTYPSAHLSLSKDSVLVFFYIEGDFGSLPVLIDKSGKMLKEYSLLKPEEKQKKIFFEAQKHTPLFLDNNLWVTFYNMRPSQDTSFFSSEQSYVSKIDVNTSKVENTLAVKFPKSYHGHFWRGSFYWTTGKNKEKIYSFSSSSFLVVEDSTGKEKYYPAKSSKIDTIPPLIDWQDLDNKINYGRITPYYKEIMYDNYNQLYYRIAKSYKKEEAQYHLIVLDTDFKKLGEMDFPFYISDDNRNLPLIGREGLYFRKLKNIPKNKLVFYLYKINIL